MALFRFHPRCRVKGIVPLVLIGVLSVSIWQVSIVSAQRPNVRPTGRVPGSSANRPASGPSSGPNQNKSSNSQNKKPGEEKDDEKAKDEKDKKESSDEKEDSIQRPSKPPRVPDPREFDVKPDKNSMLEFTFHGQMWPDLLQWLASISGKTLDWQELPNDFVYVSTDRPYTVGETKDLFNRLLFERGYTMVEQYNVLLVMKIEDLDPSLLKRVEDESQLHDLPAHDFVKITFSLPDKLPANTAAEDIKPLLTQHAKVQPLMATNRLLVVDLVANLRDVSRLINDEHAAAVEDIVPKEFPLRFARADRVADQVMILLGLDPSSRRTPQELQVEQQRLQLFMQMHRKGRDVSKYIRGNDAPPVFISVNHRNNSIIVNAPPKEVGIIKRTIEMLDVPSGTLPGATSAELELKRYKLVTLKPESIVSALESIGELDPRTRLRMDSDAKTVFASATQRDHQKIKAMIDRLDGSGRQFEVIWLRRLPADRVAATIHSLMVGQEEEDEGNRQSYYYYSPFRRSRDSNNEQPNKGFRIEADVENNRLMLWATDAEMEEVRSLLRKLGELPGESGNPNHVRVLPRRGEADTAVLIQKLKQMWPSVGDNELRIEFERSQPADQDTDGESNSTPLSPGDEHPSGSQPDDAPASSGGSAEPSEIQEGLGFRLRTLPGHGFALGTGAGPVQLAMAMPDDETADAETKTKTKTKTKTRDVSSASPAQPAPITVSVNQRGELVIASRDTRALDRLEHLIDQVASKPKNFEVFYLRNALASLVTLNLEEYFADELAAQDSDNGWDGYYFGYYSRGNEASDEPQGLNQSRKLRFIYDYDTNSIIVSGASPAQLETIRRLIEIYDKPVSDESISARRFKIFELEHAQAEAVAETIKDVYRDLLSSKDKAFQNQKGGKQESSQTTNYYRVYGSSSDDEKKPTKVKASFAGALSVGVDKVSNTVIVSAQEEWMESITEMIRYLDQAAEPAVDSVRVVNTQLNPAELQRALSGTFGGNVRKADSDQEKESRKPDASNVETREARRGPAQNGN